MKLPYANTDTSLHYNHSEPKVTADWRQEYIRLLEISDYDSAERLKAQNMISDECRKWRMRGLQFQMVPVFALS